MRSDFDRGEFYPVVSSQVGDKYVAGYSGTQRVASTYAGHKEDLARMKVAEGITDAIYANREGGTEFTNRVENPESGYLVSYNGWGGQFDGIDGRYGEVYAAVVECLEAIESIDSGDRAIGVGWWTFNDVTYIDVSTVLDDRNEALAFAERADQVAIFDIQDGTDIDIRYA